MLIILLYVYPNEKILRTTCDSAKTRCIEPLVLRGCYEINVDNPLFSHGPGLNFIDAAEN